MFRFNLLFLTLLLIFNTSCDYKQKKINNLTEKINNLEYDLNTTSNAEWERLKLELDNISNDIDSNRQKYTEVQIEEFKKLEGKFIALSLKRKIKNLDYMIKDFGDQVNGFSEELKSKK